MYVIIAVKSNWHFCSLGRVNIAMLVKPLTTL